MKRFEANFFDHKAGRVAEPLVFERTDMCDAIRTVANHLVTIRDRTLIIEVTVEEIIDDH